jgi:hypothetical protein
MKGLMPSQCKSDTHIARRAALQFLNAITKQEHIKIVRIVESHMLFGSPSLTRALVRVFILLIHGFCSLLTIQVFMQNE